MFLKRLAAIFLYVVFCLRFIPKINASKVLFLIFFNMFLINISFLIHIGLEALLFHTITHIPSV